MVLVAALVVLVMIVMVGVHSTFLVIFVVEVVTGVTVVIFKYRSIEGDGINKVYACLFNFGHRFHSA